MWTDFENRKMCFRSISTLSRQSKVLNLKNLSLLMKCSCNHAKQIGNDYLFTCSYTQS